MVRFLILGVVALVAGLGLYVHYRASWEHSKRLRVVVPGRFYRSGQMTVEGFEEAIKQLKIRTVINVQDDYPNPTIIGHHVADEKEAALCERLGVRYIALAPDLLPRTTPGGPRPRVINQFLGIMDREDIYPALIHCKAGLHRTGVLCAVWRMEYQGWSSGAAFRELKAHGFGDRACTTANDYVRQYVLDYLPRTTREGLALRSQR